MALLGPLAAPAYSFAQTSLEGVWSGIFTTRHDPYWHIEDWGCFNGCTDEGIAHLKALLADPKNDHVPVFALIGQSWAFMRESMRPHVIGPGVEIFDTINDANDPTLELRAVRLCARGRERVADRDQAQRQEPRDRLRRVGSRRARSISTDARTRRN